MAMTLSPSFKLIDLNEYRADHGGGSLYSKSNTNSTKHYSFLAPTKAKPFNPFILKRL